MRRISLALAVIFLVALVALGGPPRSNTASTSGSTTYPMGAFDNFSIINTGAVVFTVQMARYNNSNQLVGWGTTIDVAAVGDPGDGVSLTGLGSGSTRPQGFIVVVAAGTATYKYVAW